VAHFGFHSAVRPLNARIFSCATLFTVLALTAPAAFAHADHSDAGAEPWVAAALLIAGVLYLRGLYLLRRSAGVHRAAVIRTSALFGVGWLVLAGALVSPFAGATEGLFSAHMIQHELLMVLAAPLMVLGRPLAIWTWSLPPAWRRGAASPFRSRGFSRAWRFVSAPLPATVIHAIAIWLWHVPTLFEQAEASVVIHALQHSAFLGSALLFWWALLKPGRESGTGAAVLCLFVTMLHTGALGVLLTFSGEVWYPASTSHAATWGLAALEDQQLGGLIMWVPGGIPYIVAALALAARWFRSGAETPRRDLNVLPQ
jgi:putative membrane protein